MRKTRLATLESIIRFFYELLMAERHSSSQNSWTAVDSIFSQAPLLCNSMTCYDNSFFSQNFSLCRKLQFLMNVSKPEFFKDEFGK
jgi:hypothetical protein